MNINLGLNKYSIKSLLIGTFALIALLVSFMIAFVLPTQIDAEMRQRLDSDLLPTLRADMEDLSQQVKNQLQEKKKNNLENAKQAFGREKQAIANGLISKLRPMAEEFNTDGMETAIAEAIEAQPSLVGIRLRIQEGDEWKEFGETSTASTQTFSAENKSQFAYIGIEMFYKTDQLQKALKQEEQSFTTVMTNISTASTNLLDKTEKGIGVLQQQMSEGVHNKIITLAAITVAAIITMIVVIMWVLDRVIIKPLGVVVETLNKISEGDLQVEITVEGKNEVSKLLAGMETMVTKVRSSLQLVATATDQLATTADETTVITEETNQAIKDQQDNTTQLATAINQMSSTIQEVANNCSQASQSAADANNEASTGQQSMHETITQIQHLATEIHSTVQVIQQLEKNSIEIGGILDVIKGIAEQTNLLALNAAIEAARAGEQGRGFAVVADEVRTLANRTQSSTEEINAMIVKLQEGSRMAAAAMEQSRSDAEGAVEQANKTGSALTTITEAIGSISDMNTQIASAAEEQGAVAEEINRNITHIDEMAKQTSAGSSQTAIASTELAKLAAKLQQTVKQFKL